MNTRVAFSLIALMLGIGCTPYIDPADYARSLADPPCTTPVTAPDPSYEIPGDAPQGHLIVEAPSMTSLAPHRGGPDDAPFHAVKLVVVVTNRSSEPWFVKRDEQAIDLSTRDKCIVLAPVASTTGESASIEVKPHTENWIALYFDLPTAFRGQDALAYQVVWVVHAGARRIVGRTTFEDAHQREPT